MQTGNHILLYFLLVTRFNHGNIDLPEEILFYQHNQAIQSQEV
jgi:hypothetical protein